MFFVAALIICLILCNVLYPKQLQFKDIGYLCVPTFFLLSNLESWNFACICKIEIPQHFVHGKFSIFGLEIGLHPENQAKRRPTASVV